jgi:nucleotide-binding universal stress UspA family protein
MPSFQSICCPVDFSDGSHAALELAASVAARLGARLTLLHVREPAPLASSAVFAPPPFPPLVRGEFAPWPWPPAPGAPAAGEPPPPPPDDGTRLQRWRDEAERLGAPTVETALVGGPAPATIVRFVRDRGMDLLVLARRGHPGSRWHRMGAVATQVFRHAPCPVLVVPGAGTTARRRPRRRTGPGHLRPAA